MKSSITITCSCGEPLTLETTGTKPIKDIQCTNCEAALFFVQPLGDFVGVRILSRAWEELKAEDYTLTIILSAMAVECEMARLFIKWKGIDLMATTTGMPTQADEDTWADQWRKLFRIGKRLDALSKLLTGQDFDSFLTHKPALLKSVHATYPASSTCASPKAFFGQEFFNKRNKIVHHGEIDFAQADGEMCFTLASTLFQVMREMDAVRLKALDAAHEADLLNRGEPL